MGLDRLSVRNTCVQKDLSSNFWPHISVSHLPLPLLLTITITSIIFIIILLHSLHRHPVEQRIEYKISLLCFKVISDLKKKKKAQARNELSSILPKSSHARKKPRPESATSYLSDLLRLLSFFTLPLGSSVLQQTLECAECHPSAHGPVVSVLSLTRLQLPGTDSLLLVLSVMLPLRLFSTVP